MKHVTRAMLVFAVAAVTSGFALAQAPDAHGSIAPRFDHPIANVPTKSLIAVEIQYPPGGESDAHHHANSAFIMAYVIPGSIVSQVEGEPEHTFHARETGSKNRALTMSSAAMQARPGLPSCLPSLSLIAATRI